MSKISAMLDVGKRSLMNNQTALQTVSHNIANKSTEGYSRQRVDQQSAVPIGTGGIRVGMGSKVADVSRTNNGFLEKQILKEGSEFNFNQSKSNALSRVEEVYNEQINKGLNKYVGEFFNAFRDLASAPENLANRTLVRESSINLTKDFSRVSRQLKSIQGDIDGQIKGHVHEINRMTGEVAKLNEKIQQVELSGVTANDERDRRDQLLKDIAEKVSIKWAEGDNGMVTISAGGGSLLVSGYESMDLKAQIVENKDVRGGLQTRVFFSQSDKHTPVDVTNYLSGGEIGGVLSVRDNTIERLLDEVDEMAFEFAKQVNDVHRTGYNSLNQTGQSFFAFENLEQNVRSVASDGSNNVSGQGNNQKNNQFDAAATIVVDKDIIANVGKISVAALPGSTGDNRVANVISSLQYKNVIRDQSSFDEFYNGMVGQVGVLSNQANSRVESQGNIVSQLKNLRESISGVSLDEETAKMIEFQKSFEASARLIRTADEMFDTVLTLKR